MRRDMLWIILCSAGCASSELDDGVPGSSSESDELFCVPDDALPEAAHCEVEWKLEIPGGSVVERGRALLDGDGQYLEYVEQDGQGDTIRSTFQEFDGLGRLVRADGDLDGDGVIDEVVTREFADHCGAIAKHYDEDVDGVPDVTETATYDENGWVEEIVGIRADGLAPPGGYARWRISYDNTETTSERVYDGEDDGVYESRTFYQYDDEGRLLVQEYDYMDDGLDSRTTWTHGPDGWLTLFREAFSTRGLGPDEQIDRTYADGRLSVEVSDEGRDGDIDEELRYSYDEAGRLTRVRTDDAPEVDPDTDLRLVYTYTCPGGSSSGSVRPGRGRPPANPPDLGCGSGTCARLEPSAP